MEDSSQFERLSAWLHGQKQSVERVELGQKSAADLISTAEYELGCIVRDLKDLELDPGRGIAGLAAAYPDLARVAGVADSDAATSAQVAALEETLAAMNEPVANPRRVRESAPLLARIKDVSSDAA